MEKRDYCGLSAHDQMFRALGVITSAYLIAYMNQEAQRFREEEDLGIVTIDFRVRTPNGDRIGSPTPTYRHLDPVDVTSRGYSIDGRINGSDYQPRTDVVRRC
tara:strand:- start:226 stop:534 length:309 start_codon:yes stop_codon:yes gene_type:complete